MTEKTQQLSHGQKMARVKGIVGAVWSWEAMIKSRVTPISKKRNIAFMLSVISNRSPESSAR